MQLVSSRLSTLALLVVTAIAGAEQVLPDVAPVAPAPSSGLTVLPAVLELGTVAPGTVVHERVWLVNDSRLPVTVVQAKADCGCTSVEGFAGVTLAPGAARAVDLRVTAPREPGRRKDAHVRFATAWGAPGVVACRIAATPDGVVTTAESAADAPPSDGRGLLVLDSADLGRVRPDAPIDTGAWFINTGTTAVSLTRVKAGCGCTQVVGFEPATVAPGAAHRLRFRVTPGTRRSGPKVVSIAAHLEAGPPLRVPMRMIVDEPAPATARR